MGLWVRKTAECFKWGFMGHVSKSMEDSGAKSNVAYDGPAKVVSEENISKWPRDHT